jgi:hypothetical protein
MSMSWYFQHQRARDIIAEHERVADKIRLARLYDRAERDALSQSPRRSPIRRAIGGTVLAFGEAVTRVGHALDGAETSPNS